MIIQPPFSEESYSSIVSKSGGDPQAIFRALARAIAARFYRQVKIPAPSELFINKLMDIVWQRVHDEGLPVPLDKKESGKAQDFDFDYIHSLVNDCLEMLPRHRTEDYLRVLISQLFLTLLAREFRTCRMSYTDRGSDDVCARQSVDHCTDRISGSHCEDCPYTVALSDGQNYRLLRRTWQSPDSIEDMEVREMMLPRDFRSLRVFWHLYIRYGTTN